MSEYLCTFSGKSGDILWSLPTAKRISEMMGAPVDFAVMPYYEKMLPLLNSQPYIDRVFAIESWLRTHSNHGDQPWEAPTVELTDPSHYEGKTFDPLLNAFLVKENEKTAYSYKKIWHLGYRGHPGINAPEMPLIDFIAWQQGIKLVEPVVPFMEARWTLPGERFVAYAFNEQYEQDKKTFLSALLAEMVGTDIGFINLNQLDWLTAAHTLAGALLFVGCRSANWVIAQGLGKEAITFEPHPARHAKGHLGKVFGCPYGREFPLPFGMPAVESAKVAASVIKSRMEKTTE